MKTKSPRKNDKTVKVTVSDWDVDEIPAEEEPIFSNEDLADLTEKYLRLMEQYTDALAIIRYLENKVITAIQHDARSRS